VRATPQEPNQIHVLEFGYELDFIFELHETLSGMRRKSLHRYLQSLGKLALAEEMSKFRASFLERK